MEKRIEKQVDLYLFCVVNHPDKVNINGNSIRPKKDNSVSVKKGYCTYYDFNGSGHIGNGVEFLVKYLDYDKDSAIKALSEFKPPEKFNVECLPITFEVPVPYVDNDRCYTYLYKKRGIKPDIVQMLIEKGLLYASKCGNNINIVFMNREKDYAEIRGTIDDPDRKAFRRKARGCNNSGFWWFSPVDDYALKTIQKIYVCEASIDAISLYQLIVERAIYISIGGTDCQQAIERIKTYFSPHMDIVLAVDNDKAGKDCRNRNKDLKHIIPEKYKDWNEVLLNSR